jgi:hypothetical protein
LIDQPAVAPLGIARDIFTRGRIGRPNFAGCRHDIRAHFVCRCSGRGESDIRIEAGACPYTFI